MRHSQEVIEERVRATGRSETYLDPRSGRTCRVGSYTRTVAGDLPRRLLTYQMLGDRRWPWLLAT